MKKFLWNYTISLNQPLPNYDNMIIIYDHNKILDKIDKEVECENNFENVKIILDKIKNNSNC
jgi:hypothetical protein